MFYSADIEQKYKEIMKMTGILTLNKQVSLIIIFSTLMMYTGAFLSLSYLHQFALINNGKTERFILQKERLFIYEN